MKRAPTFFRIFRASHPLSSPPLNFDLYRNSPDSLHFSDFALRFCFPSSNSISFRRISSNARESDIDNHSNLFDKVIESDETSYSQKLGNDKCSLTDLIQQNIKAFVPCKRGQEQQSANDSCHNWNTKENLSKSKKYQEENLENLTSRTNRFSDVGTEEDSDMEEMLHAEVSVRKQKRLYKVLDSNRESICYNTRKASPERDCSTPGKLVHGGKTQTRLRKPYEEENLTSRTNRFSDIGTEDSDMEEMLHAEVSVRKQKRHYKVLDSNRESTCYNTRKASPERDCITPGKLVHGGKTQTRLRKPDYSNSEAEEKKHSRGDIGRQRKVKMTKGRSR